LVSILGAEYVRKPTLSAEGRLTPPSALLRARAALELIAEIVLDSACGEPYFRYQYILRHTTECARPKTIAYETEW
jgi:hypothetical protein